MGKRGVLIGILTVAAGLGAGVAAAEEATPTRVLIDTDPGIDDAMAVLLALRSPSLEVVAITTVFGNTTTEQATVNALRLVELARASVPVARGAERPLVLEPREPPTFVHGADGLGEIGAPLPTTAPVEQGAAELIVEMARRWPARRLRRALEAKSGSPSPTSRPPPQLMAGLSAAVSPLCRPSDRRRRWNRLSFHRGSRRSRPTDSR